MEREELMQFAGPNATEILDLCFKHSARTTLCSPFVPKKAKGSTVQSVDGEWYLDFTSGVGVSNLGYRVEEVYDAILTQLSSGLTQFLYHDWANELPAKLCERLAQIAPGRFFKKVFLCSSGAEANEAALKLCFAKRPERKRVIAFEGAFHGRTLGCVPLHGSKEVHLRHYPIAYQAHRFPFPAKRTDWPSECLGAMKRAFKKFIPPGEVNVMILELVQGEGGIIPADPEAVKALFEFCREHNILFVVDEIQTGMGRTGKMFACEHYGIEPDVITLAKALGSGVIPIGAAIFISDLDWSENGRHSSTNGGNILAASAAIKTIEIMQRDGFFENVSQKSRLLEARLRALKDNCPAMRFIRQVRGLGMMWGIDFADSSVRDAVIRECLKRKLIVIGAGESVLRVMPPLVITAEEIEQGVKIIAQSINAAVPQL